MHMAEMARTRGGGVARSLERVCYDPDQPRAPAGTPEGGQWVAAGSGGLSGLGLSPEPPDPGRPPSELDSPEGAEWLRRVETYNEWERTQRRRLHAAISEGRISVDAARRHRAYQNPPNMPREGWQPLPPVLYHVTTAMRSVLESGLKTRDEVRAAGAGSVGLGGGSSETISFTTDMDTARGILRGLREAHAAATGTLTIPEMLRQAEQGVGARSPWADLLRRHVKDIAYEAYRRNRYVIDEFNHRRWFGGPADVDIGGAIRATALPSGAEPVGSGWVGGDGVRRYMLYTVPVEQLPAPVQREVRLDVYKAWAGFREHRGGPLDPLFVGTDAEALARLDPRDFGIVKARPVPGARGYPMPAPGAAGGLAEWRTHSGLAVTVEPVDVDARLAEWNPEDHPRHPAGTPEGGQFAPKGGAGAGPPGGRKTPVGVREKTPGVKAPDDVDLPVSAEASAVATQRLEHQFRDQFRQMWGHYGKDPAKADDTFAARVAEEAAYLRASPLVHATSAIAAGFIWKEGLKSRDLMDVDRDMGDLKARLEELYDIEGLSEEDHRELDEIERIVGGTTFEGDRQAGLDRYTFFHHGGSSFGSGEYGRVHVLVDNTVLRQAWATPHDIVAYVMEAGADVDPDRPYPPKALQKYWRDAVRGEDIIRAASAGRAANALGRFGSFEVKAPGLVGRQHILGFVSDDMDSLLYLRDTVGIPENMLHYVESQAQFDAAARARQEGQPWPRRD